MFNVILKIVLVFMIVNAIMMYLVIVGGTRDKSIEEIEYEKEAQTKEININKNRN